MKTLKVTGIVVVIILIVPLLGYVGWLLKKGTNMEVIVVNKAMYSYHSSENSSLNYVLDSKKILTAANQPYNLKTDFLGIKELNGELKSNMPRLRDVDRIANEADLVYYADVSEPFLKKHKSSVNNENNDQALGGLNNTDYSFIRDIISMEKPLVLECNFICPPTEDLVRYNLEKLMDIYYLGWIGKYTDRLEADPLSNEIFNWKDMYTSFTGNEYEFTGEGIILMDPAGGRVVILQEGKHIQSGDGLIITNKEWSEKLHLPEKVNYSGWFTLLHPGQNTVISEFTMNPTDIGLALLNEQGIPYRFPAAILTEPQTYLFAGDFGKNTVSHLFSKVVVIRPVHDAIKRRNYLNSKNFFYSYYQPFMTSIVESAMENQRVETEE